MHISAQTPNRVDLAGGTLDIYPLYLFEEGSITVNIAIQIYSQAEIETRNDSKIEIFSEDLNQKVFFPSFEACLPKGELDLLIRAIRAYPPKTGIVLRTKNQAPQGSGLGASSALLMATSAALNALQEKKLDIQEIVDIGANLEAQTIRIPTGKQDYLAAMHGGINVFWFDEKGIRREPILYSEKELQELESHLVLSYTGLPHFSGENNWTIMRRYIDGELSTVKALGQIKATAFKMREAVLKRHWEKIGEALHEEWENRKALAQGVTTDVVEHLMAKAQHAGAKASKLCGAGGGGCMITWVEPNQKKKVEQVLEEEGAKILPFHVALKGIQIHSSPEKNLKF
jgi:D-glycero-alpha-D-manno-heptose-7-phosphate kinase